MEDKTNTNKEPNKFYETFVKPNLPKNKKEWVWFIIIILIVITLGLVAVNQYLAISYKATLIQSPCNLCKDFQNRIVVGGGDVDLSKLDLSNISLSRT